MTEWIVCENCDFVLYWGESIKDRMFMKYSEQTFVEKYGTQCPNCNTSLSMESVKIIFEE